jgi:hypothetical protein
MQKITARTVKEESLKFIFAMFIADVCWYLLYICMQLILGDLVSKEVYTKFCLFICDLAWSKLNICNNTFSFSSDDLAKTLIELQYILLICIRYCELMLPVRLTK